MKNLKFSRLFAAVMFVACLAFVGCKPQTEEVTVEKVIVVRPLEADDAIIGNWLSTYGEKFSIEANAFKNAYGDSDCYEGNNVFVAITSDTTGFIYFKYTKAFCAEHSDFDNYYYAYDEDAPDVGKWYAISYKGLTENSVQLSGAAGTKTSCNTLKEAIDEFTIDNKYFGTYSECAKQ